MTHGIKSAFFEQSKKNHDKSGLIINKMKEILHSSSNNDVGILSNYQLIGIINERVKYHPELISEIKQEISRRKITNLEIDILSEKYRAFQLIEEGGLRFGKSMIAVLILSILIAISLKPLYLGISACIIIGISIIGVKVKFEQGIKLEKRLWSIFGLLITVSFFILIGILMWKK